MKILRIKNNKGEYSLDGSTFNNIVNISKEDLKTIVDIIMEQEDIELDVIDDEKRKIENKAENIIYSDLYIKLNNLIEKKQEIIDRINSKYSNLIEKYQLE